jgi:hypothetical protein
MYKVERGLNCGVMAYRVVNLARHRQRTHSSWSSAAEAWDVARQLNLWIASGKLKIEYCCAACNATANTWMKVLKIVRPGGRSKKPKDIKHIGKS